jgi:hypothetical protein
MLKQSVLVQLITCNLSLLLKELHIIGEYDTVMLKNWSKIPTDNIRALLNLMTENFSILSFGKTILFVAYTCNKQHTETANLT